MIWANKNNERIKATPKDKANCPICNEEVIAKCGSIKIWHWSHKSLIFSISPFLNVGATLKCPI